MSDETVEFPCARGCTQPEVEGEDPKPRPATHGTLCASCFYRVKHALEIIPDLMANMRAKIVGSATQDLSRERVSGSGDGAPAPLRIDPLDASDSLFAKLVSWTELFGGKLGHAQPSVAVWMNMREAQGSKPVTVEKAHELASSLVQWYLVRLNAIAATDIAGEFHDDLCYGWEDARGVFALNAAYGVELPQRKADKRECPVCGHVEVFVAWPSSFNPDIMVLCGRCKWVAEPELYGHYAKLFERA